MTNRRSPSGPRITWQPPVAASADLPADGNEPGDARVTLDTSVVWIWNGALWTTGGAAEDHKESGAATTAGWVGK